MLALLIFAIQPGVSGQRNTLWIQDLMLLSDARRWYAFDPSARDTVLRAAESAPHLQE